MPPSHHISVFYPAPLTHYCWDKSPSGWQAIKNCPSSFQMTFVLSWGHSFILIFTFAALASSVHQSEIKFAPTLKGCINVRPVYKGALPIDVPPNTLLVVVLINCKIYILGFFFLLLELTWKKWQLYSVPFTIEKIPLDSAQTFSFSRSLK